MISKPRIIPFEKAGVNDITSYLGVDRLTITSVYEQQVRELHELAFSDHDIAAFRSQFEQNHGKGNWIYLPWRNEVVHSVGKTSFLALKTSRNQYLISAEEQSLLQQKKVAIAGMSAGFMVAQPLAMSGIAGALSIADPDTLDSSNLNRLPWPFYAVDSSKTAVAARQLFELNPYLKLEVYDGPVTPDMASMAKFAKAADIIVDEVDDFKLKIQLRQFARKQGIPVFMATSLGDNVLIDIERYDLQPDLELFNGALGHIPDEILQQQTIDTELIKRYSVQLVGSKYIPTRALESVRDMGKKLGGRPQLFSTVSLAGDLLAYVIRGTLLDKNNSISSGRYFVELPKLFGRENAELASTDVRESLLQEFKNAK